MKKVIIILSAVIFLPFITLCQDIPVYRDNEIAGYLYTEIPTVNLDDYYLLDTIKVFEKKIIVQTAVSYFGTDIGIELFAPSTHILVEEMNNDTTIIKFYHDGVNVSGISVKKDKTGDIRIYNIFTFDINNRDEICIKEVDRLLEDKIIMTHTKNDTFTFPVFNKREKPIKQTEP